MASLWNNLSIRSKLLTAVSSFTVDAKAAPPVKTIVITPLHGTTERHALVAAAAN